MQARFILPWVATMLVLACGKKQETENFAQESQPVEIQRVRIQPVAWSGMLVPGGMAEAKKGGFTECKLSYHSYECSQPKPLPIYGVTPKVARIFMDGHNYDMEGEPWNGKYQGVDIKEVPPEDLRFGHLIFNFDFTYYNQACVDKHEAETGKSSFFGSPLSCAKTENSIEHFVHALQDNGWVEDGSRADSRNYVHPRHNIKIFIQKNVVQVSYLSPQALQSALSHIEAARMEDAKAQTFIDSMKQ